MKNTTSKKRNKLPLLLGALLLISLAAYGTRAYFSDSAEEQAGIKLTLGRLDIEPADKSEWKYVPLKEDNMTLTDRDTDKKFSEENAKEIKYVQPGDAFERIFTFENVGTLAQKVNVTKEVPVGDNKIFKMSFQQVEDAAGTNPKEIIESKDTIILPTKKVYYKMIISVDTANEFDDKYNNKNEKIGNEAFVFKAIEEAIQVKAVQTNE